MALSVPLSRFTPRVGGGSAFFVRCHPRFMHKARELQELIDKHRKALADHSSNAHIHAPITIAHRQAEILVAASQLAEISTRRIIYLTWALLVVTIGLLAVEARTIFIPKNPDASSQHIQSSQYE